MKNSRLAAALGALALAACTDRVASRPPPTDRFYYPTAVAVRHLDAAGQDCIGGAAGCTTQLLVVSSNFDLAFDLIQGGTLLSVAVPPDPPPAAALPLEVPDLDVRGAVTVGSLAGELSVVDETTCPGWANPAAATPRPAMALVTSRADNALFRVDLAADLTLGCDASRGAAAQVVPCRVDLDPAVGDPYGVGVACRGTGAAFQAQAYVGYLLTPSGIGELGRVDLASASAQLSSGSGQPCGWYAPAQTVATDPSPLFCQETVSLPLTSGIVGSAPQSFSYDPVGDRLWFTGRFAGGGTMPFRFLELGNTVGLPKTIDLWGLVPGAETRGFALSSSRTRAYVALRLYDPDVAINTGGRPGDTGGALGIIDLTPDGFGQPRGVLLAAIPVGRGPGEVRVIPRPGRPDLVVLTCTGDDSVWLYDDDTESVAKVFGRDGSGRPVAGRMPFALAVEPRLGGAWRAYVASFDSSQVTVIDIPDPSRPRDSSVVMRLGRVRP